MIKKTISRAAFAIACGAILLPVAHAQSGDSAADDSDEFVLNRVTVTAQKTEQDIQDVPISVDVLGGETIERLALNDLADLSRNLPNFRIQKSGGSNLVSIRGVGSGPNRGFEQSVGMFIDGIFAGREQQFSVPFFDLERVEVLKGTQSILFGKNTIAGAVNITTARPTEEFEASITGYYETEYGEKRVSGYVSGPLSDTFRARLALQLAESDGFLSNSLTGEDEVADENFVGRVSFEWEPASNLLVWGKYERAEADRTGSPFQLIDFGTFQGLFTAFDPNVESDLDLDSSLGQFNDNVTDIESDNAALQIEYEFGGGYKLTSTTGYSAFESSSTDDSDFTPVPLIAFQQSQDFEQFSQELRLESPKDGPFSYVVGAFYQDGSYFNDPRFDVQGPLINFPPTATARIFDQDSEVVSVFAEGTFSLTEQLRIIAGLRYSDEDKSALKSTRIDVFQQDTPQTNPAIIGFTAAAFGATNHVLDLERNESDTSPALTVQYDFGDDEMVYAKVTQGFKSGGFDVSDQGGVDVEYEGEEATSYEVGLKSRFANDRAELNAAIFRTEFEDLQVSALSGVTFITTNAAEALTQGVEVNGRWQVAPELLFTGSVAYTDATYDEYTSAPCNAEQEAEFTGTGACLADLSGERLFGAPEWSGNFNLQHFADLPNGFSLETNAGLNYVSETFVGTDLSQAAEEDGYATIDLSGTIYSPNEHWSVSVIGRNLTDERVRLYQLNVPVFTGARSAIVNPPRTIAVSASLRF